MKFWNHIPQLLINVMNKRNFKLWTAVIFLGNQHGLANGALLNELASLIFLINHHLLSRIDKYFSIQGWFSSLFGGGILQPLKPCIKKKLPAESHGRMEWKTNPTWWHGCSGCPCLLIPCGRLFIFSLSMSYVGRGS